MDEAQLEQEIKLIQEWLKNNPDDPQASYLHSELERSHIALREKERLRQVRAHQSHAAPTIHFGQLSDKDLRAAYIRSTREREILRMSFSYRMSTVLNALRKAKQDPSIAESEWPSKWSIEESADVWNYGISKDLFIPSEKPAVYISMDILATMTYPQRFHDAYHGALADKASSGYPEVKVDPASGLSDDEIWSYGCRKGLFLISEHERIHHDRRPYDGKFEEQEEEEIKSTRRKFESEQYQNWVAQGEQLRSPAPFIQGAAFGAFGWPVAATYGAIQTGATGAELYEACVKGEGDCSTAVVQMGTVVATHYTMRGRPGDVTGGEPAAPPPEPQNPTVLPGTPPVVRAEPLTTSAPKPLVQEPPPVPMQAGPAKPSAPAPSATTAPGTALTKSSGPDPAGTTASTALRSLDDRIRDAEAQLGPKRQSVIEYKAKREAAGEKQKGGPYKGIWNVKEEIWVLKRQKAFPNRQILKQAYIKGVKGSEGTVRATEDIAGAGRILDYVEIEGNQVAGGDLKSAAELMQSIEGGVKKPTSIEGRFRPKSKIGGQRIIEAKVLETARTTGGKLVITGTDVRTGNQVTIEVEPARYQSNVIPYESVYPD